LNVFHSVVSRENPDHILEKIKKEKKNITGSNLEWSVISSSLTRCSNSRMNTVIPISFIGGTPSHEPNSAPLLVLDDKYK
jgi:hypothetical protein